jgi:hypothetical protein
MFSRVGILTLLLVSPFSTLVGHAQPGYRQHNPAERVLDLAFPIDVPAAQKPYFVKMALRYWGADPEQFVIVIYSDSDKYWIRKCEITKYVFGSESKAKLPQVLSKLSADSSDEAVRAAAAQLNVEVSRYMIAPEALSKTLTELRSIRISPAITDRIGLDDVSEYEFWYDTWEESDYFSIMGPFKDDPQDALTRWMIKFKADLPDLLKKFPDVKPSLP